MLPRIVNSAKLRKRPPNGIAITTNKVCMTVDQIESAAYSVANAISLWSAGHKKCLLLPSSNPVNFVVGIIACQLAGAVVVPWREKSLLLEDVVDLLKPDGILQFASDLPHMATISTVPGSLDSSKRVGEIIMLTSGSTGSPKGVALEFDQLLLNAQHAGAALQIWRCSGWSIDMDMALMSALCHFLMAWQYDLPLHHISNRDAKDVSLIFKSGAIGFGGSPIQLVRLREQIPMDTAPTMLVSSGDFLLPAMIDEVHANFPGALINKLYGLTEVAGRLCCMPHELLMQNKAAAGFPITGFQVRLAEPDSNGAGEIEVKSPLVMAGYYHSGGNFEPNTLDWFGTGDLGFFSPDGAITLLGRRDDVMKVGGEKVDRQTIEFALKDVLSQFDYCVLGVSHPLVGISPALFISNFNEAENPPKWLDIVTHLRKRVPNRFIPALMYILPQGLPRLANGKIDRQTLKSNHQTYTRLR